jgi:predicted nucleic-acid-binding Zn-ribbon protein
MATLSLLQPAITITGSKISKIISVENLLFILFSPGVVESINVK